LETGLLHKTSCSSPVFAFGAFAGSPLRPSREKAILENPQIFQNCEF
jgi:hypothetical protein